MAQRYYIRTSAGRGEFLSAFGRLLLTRPTLKERFVLSKVAQLRSNLTWTRHTVPGADVAARLVTGGLNEAISSSRIGPGSLIGTVIALSVEAAGSGSTGQLWLAGYPTFFGMNQMGGVLKAYAKGIAKDLEAGGATVVLDRG